MKEKTNNIEGLVRQLSETIRDELFLRHSHAKIENERNPEGSVFTQKDVLEMLVIQKELLTRK